MNGFPLEVSKRLLNDLISGLRPTDMFNIILFAGGHKMLAESFYLLPQRFQKAFDLISNQQGGGSTQLLPALKQSLSLPQNVEGISRSIVVVTDGYIGVEPEAFDLVRKNLNKANLFAFGIGSSVNRHLIEGLAYAGQGVPAIVLMVMKLRPQQRNSTVHCHPVFTQSQLPFLDLMRIYRAPFHSGCSIRKTLVIFGKWRGNHKAYLLTASQEILIKNKSVRLIFWFPAAPGLQEKKLNWNKVSVLNRIKTSALRYYGPEHTTSVSRFPDTINSWTNKKSPPLGLDYNLLTEYTSFVRSKKWSPWKKDTLKQSPTIQCQRGICLRRL